MREDNERELYSLDTMRVSKGNLPTFGGKDHEEEYVEKGFKSNRIIRDEQIFKLRECLKGYSQKLVPESWRIVKQAFENLIKIINFKKRVL